MLQIFRKLRRPGLTNSRILRKYDLFQLQFQGDEENKLLNIPTCNTIVMVSNQLPEDKEHVTLNERVMNQWLNLVWFSNVSNQSLLIVDNFQTHTNNTIQKTMVNRGGCLAIIPSACSQKLQPLHRGMKSKFKV